MRSQQLLIQDFPQRTSIQNRPDATPRLRRSLAANLRGRGTLTVALDLVPASYTLVLLNLLSDGTYAWATGASSDGTIISGVADTTIADQGGGATWNESTQDGTPLNLLAPGNFASANGVSANGLVAVGGANDNRSGTYREYDAAVAWNAGTGVITELARQAGVAHNFQGNERANACDAAGSRIVGCGLNTSNRTDALVWNAAGTIIMVLGLGTGPIEEAQAFDITPDAAWAVGINYAPGDLGGVGSHACRWPLNTGIIQILDSVEDHINEGANACSDDCSVIAGYSQEPGTGRVFGVRWSGAGTVLAVLPGLPGSIGNASVNGISGDGQKIVGSAVDAGAVTRAVWWDETNAIHLLPQLDGTDYSEALGISSDGTTITGDIDVPPGQTGTACCWVIG